MSRRKDYDSSVIELMGDLLLKGSLCMLEEVKHTKKPIIVGSIINVLPFIPRSYLQKESVMICHLKEIYSFDPAHRKKFKIIFLNEAATFLQNSGLQITDYIAVCEVNLVPDSSFVQRDDFYSHVSIIGNEKMNNILNVYCKKRNEKHWTLLKGANYEKFSNEILSNNKLNIKFNKRKRDHRERDRANDSNSFDEENLNKREENRNFSNHGHSNHKDATKDHRLCFPGPSHLVRSSKKIIADKKLSSISNMVESNILTKWPLCTPLTEFYMKVNICDCTPHMNDYSSEIDTLHLINGFCDYCSFFFPFNAFSWARFNGEPIAICPKCETEGTSRDLNFTLMCEMIFKDDQELLVPGILMGHFAEKFFGCSPFDLCTSVTAQIKTKKLLCLITSCIKSTEKQLVVKLISLKPPNSEQQFHVLDINMSII